MNTQNPIAAGSSVPSPGPINRTLRISGSNPNYTVVFENFTPLPGDDPLDIEVPNNSVVTLTLDTTNCDWEFDHNSPVTLGNLSTNYHNLSPAAGSVPPSQRLLQVSFEATLAPGAPGSNADPYNMNFIIHRDPGPGGTVFPNGMPFGIDPHLRNPGRPG